MIIFLWIHCLCLRYIVWISNTSTRCCISVCVGIFGAKARTGVVSLLSVNLSFVNHESRSSLRLMLAGLAKAVWTKTHQWQPPHWHRQIRAFVMAEYALLLHQTFQQRQKHAFVHG